MNVNKVEYEGRVLLDLTEDTVTPENLLVGAVAHDSSGQRIVGTMETSSGDGTKVVTGTTSSPTINTGLSKIDKLIIYANKIESKGMVDMIYNSDSPRAITTSCRKYSITSKSCRVDECTGFSVSRGTFHWTETTDEYSFMDGTTYNWIAIGS